MKDQAAAKQQEARNQQAARMQAKGVVPSTDAEAPMMKNPVKDPATGQTTTRTDLATAVVPPQPPTPEQPPAGGAPEAGAAPAAGGAPEAGAAPAAGGAPIDPTAQAAAQQGMVAQDLATIQQGKGADKQTYLGTRSGTGMLADVLSFGLTSRFGSTGSAARKKANQASEQQTQAYNQAQQRLQRTAGLTKSLSLYSDVISKRRIVQERNTTHNLRR